MACIAFCYYAYILYLAYRLNAIQSEYGAQRGVILLIYLLRYNNYYNRQVKSLPSIEAYEPYMLSNKYPTGAPIATQNPVLNVTNFKPRDGIYTEQKIDWYGDIPDYVLVAEYQDILSRWFVLDAKYIRDGQYILLLYRDVVVDYWSNIRDATAYIEKSFVNDVKNPLLYNAESGSYNQIKKKTTWLYDNTNCPWIVGYIPQNHHFLTITVDAYFPPLVEVDIEVDSLEDWEYYRYLDEKIAARDEFKLSVGFPVYARKYTPSQVMSTIESFTVTLDGTDITYTSDGISSTVDNNKKVGAFSQTGESNESLGNLATWLGNKIYTYGSYNFQSYLAELTNSKVVKLSNNQYKDIGLLNGKIIHDNNSDRYYRINATNVSTLDFSTEAREAFENNVRACLPSQGALYTGSTWSWGPLPLNTNNNLSYSYTGRAVKLELSEVDVKSVTITIPDSRTTCKEQPFDIFCMPYSDSIEIDLGSSTIVSNKDLSLAAAQQIGLSLGTNAVYDIQLLPYCPLSNLVDANGKLRGNFASTDLMSGNEVVGKMWWSSSANRTFSINIPADFAPVTTDPFTTKVKAGTQFARLCSPNYGQMFEFNVQKNRGIEEIIVQATFRPYNPWIKLTPLWTSDGLYATDDPYHDPRGLILAGDFSIAQASSAWANYELNNKNYLAIFNRQIESMEFNKQLSLWEGGLAGLGGALAGAAGGAVAGSIIQPGIGTAIGAAAGGSASLVAGGGDFIINYKRNNEAIDLTKDLFAYQLGNIKALPQGLARTAAQTLLNTLVPTLELWETTAEEEAAFTSRLSYNGFTVLIVDALNNWIPKVQTRLKAKIIYIPGIDDMHLANTIAGELDKGVYMNEYSINS